MATEDGPSIAVKHAKVTPRPDVDVKPGEELAYVRARWYSRWSEDLSGLQAQVGVHDMAEIVAWWQEKPEAAAPVGTQSSHQVDPAPQQKLVSTAELMTQCTAGPHQEKILNAWDLHVPGWSDDMSRVAHSSSVRHYALQYLVERHGTEQTVHELLECMQEANTCFTDYESFHLVTAPGAMSLEHIDGGGCGTMVTVRRGSKIWLVQDPDDSEHKELVLLTEGSQM